VQKWQKNVGAAPRGCPVLGGYTEEGRHGACPYDNNAVFRLVRVRLKTKGKTAFSLNNLKIYS